MVRYHVLTHFAPSQIYSYDRIVDLFVIYYQDKPLSKYAIALREYNLHEGDVVTIRYHGSLGGLKVLPPQQNQILLPTYTHVRECEHEVMDLLQLQHNLDFGDYKLPFGVEGLATFFESDIFRTGMLSNVNTNWLHKLLEDILFLIHDLIQAGSIEEYLKAVTYFIRNRAQISLMFSSKSEVFVAFMKSLWPQNVYETQSVEELFGEAKKYLGKFEELRKAPIFKKLYQLGLFALSFSLFEKMGITFDLFKYTAMEAAAIKEKFHMGPSLLMSLLSSVTFVCERGYQCFVTGSLDPLYHSGTQYEKWYEDAMEIKRKSKLLACPEAHDFSLFQFLADTRDIIEKGDSIAKHAVRIGALERKMVLSVLNDLKMILAEQTTRREAQKERTAPFCVCLYGGSSIGKTTITDMLFFQYGKTFNLPIDSEFKYTRNPNAKYWDGFNTSQWFVIMDDIAYMHPTIASSGDPSLMETIQTNNRVAFVPDQAALDDKGRTPFKARCVVATTNCEDMNAIHYFQTPLAMQRRFPFTIDVSVKEEFVKDACMLDSSKTKMVNGEWPSYWQFIVKRPVPDGEERRGQRARLEIVEIFDNTDDFLAWFSREAVQHERIQKLVEKSSCSMKALTICSKCYRTTSKCSCLEVQSFMPEYPKQILKEWGFHGVVAVVKSDLFPRIIQMIVNQPQAIAKLETYCLGTDRTIRGKIDSIEELDFFIDFANPDQACATLERMDMHDEDHDAVQSVTLKERFFNLGQKVLAIIGSPEFLGCLIAATGTIMGMYTLYKTLKRVFGKSQDLETSLQTSDGVAPKIVGDEKPNVWYKDTYEMSSFDISAKAQSLKGETHETIMKQLNNNLVALRAEYERDGEKYAKRFRAVCLGGHVYITNKHNLPDRDCRLQIITSKVEDGINKNASMILSKDLVWSHKKDDLVAFTIECLPPRRNICDLFVSSANRAVLRGYLIMRNDEGVIEEQIVHNYTRQNNMILTQNLTIADCWLGVPTTPTKVGDCGAIHLASSMMGPQILGLHVAGNQTSCVATLVSRECVDHIMEHFTRPTVQASTPLLSSESAERSIGDLNKKSPFRWIPEGVAAVYGSYTGWRNTPKSTVKATHIQKAVLEEGFEVKHGAPVMSSYAPWRIAALDMVNPVTDLNLSVLKKCKESFLHDILSGISKESLAQVHVYDDMTALNGAKGVAFVDKMNRNTSMGAPWRTGKKNFFINLPATDMYQDAVAFTPEIMDRVKVCVDGYKDGRRYMPVFTGQLKDEALPFRKITAKKTRVFAAAPGDWSFVVRKYLLSVIRLIQTNKFVFETAVGTNATSTQWQELREYLVQHGDDKMIAGDYGRFDKTMPPCIILAAFDIIREICREAGYTPEQLMVVQGIAEDTAFPLIDFNGDLVEFYGSNPSGHPLTVIINSLANSLYMRYCYAELSPDKSCYYFKRDVALMTYGDDNAMGVRKEASFFNHTAIQRVLSDVGITYTMADKEAESIPYIHIDQISFLKRLWRWDADVGAYLAPLEEASITKSLTVNTESKSLCPEAHAVAVMTSAHCEYFFYGKEVFHERQKMFQRIIKKSNLEMYVKDNSFPCWEELRERFWQNSA